jgi:hypothetical protein
MLTVSDHPTKFSPIDAARVALATDPLALSPAQQRVLSIAATMWCRDLSFPTVRALGAQANRAPVTVLNGFDHAVLIHAEVIRVEWAVLQHTWHTVPRATTARVDALLDHALALAMIDRVLLRLPALANAAVLAAGDPKVAARTLAPSAPLYVIASFAERHQPQLDHARERVRDLLLVASE